MPRRADDDGLLMLRANRGKPGRGVVKAEIHHHVSLPDHRPQILALINGARHFQFRLAHRAGDQRLAHPALRSRDDYFGRVHFNTPQAFSVAFNVWRFFKLIGASGSRNSSWISPIMASADLTGPGLVSM